MCVASAYLCVSERVSLALTQLLIITLKTMDFLKRVTESASCWTSNEEGISPCKGQDLV